MVSRLSIATLLSFIGLYHAFANTLASNDQHPLRSESESLYDPFGSNFEDYARSKLEEWHTPGVAISVVHGSKIWSKGFGFADIESNRPVTSHTLFQWASTSKAHTASIAALLVQNQDSYKDISWESTLHDLAPGNFAVPSHYDTSQITLIDALSHRTGMPRHDLSWILTNGSITEQARSLRYLQPSKPLRTKWQYCNLMFTAVASVIEVVTKNSVGVILKDWLWDPLGMNETYHGFYASETCQQQNPDCLWSKQYGWSNVSQTYVETPLDTNPPFNGAGGVISNVADYAKWVKTLMTASGPVSAEGHEQIRYPHMMAMKPGEQPYEGPVWYGLGMMGATYRRNTVYFHNGAIGGFFSRVTFIPELAWGMTIVQNAPNSLHDVVTHKMMDDFLGIPEYERIDMNKVHWGRWQNRTEEVKQQPKTLYPDSTSPPTKPSLHLSSYKGTYSHPAYGSVTLNSDRPKAAKPSDHQQTLYGLNVTGIKLHTKTALLGIELVFHHVTGEYWLTELREGMAVDIDHPTEFAKAKTEIGPNGQVAAILVATEPALGHDHFVRFEKIA